MQKNFAIVKKFQNIISNSVLKKTSANWMWLKKYRPMYVTVKTQYYGIHLIVKII